MTKTTGLELLMLICWALIASYTVSMVSIQLHERKLIDISKKNNAEVAHTKIDQFCSDYVDSLFERNKK